MVVGGRHPGHYFLTKEDNSDVLMRHDVCMLGMSAQSRASQFFDKVGSDFDKLSYLLLPRQFSNLLSTELYFVINML